MEVIPDPREISGINGPLQYLANEKGEPVAKTDEDMEIPSIDESWAVQVEMEAIDEDALLGPQKENQEEEPPAKKAVHPFQRYYVTSTRSEEPPKCPALKAIKGESLDSLQSFREATAECIQKPEGLPEHPLGDLKGKEVPETKFCSFSPPRPYAIYQIVDRDGASMTLTPMHPELVANDRPDLFYVWLTNTAFDTYSQKFANCSELYKGDLIFVQKLARKPGKSPEDIKRDFVKVLDPKEHNYWRVIEYRMVPRNIWKRQEALSMGRNGRDYNRKETAFAINHIGSIAYFPTKKLSKRKVDGVWMEADVFAPVATAGKLMSSIDPSYRVTVTKEVSLITPTWTFDPTILSITEMEQEEATHLDSIPVFFRNNRMTKENLESFARAVKLGIHGQVALQTERYDNRAYPTEVVSATQGLSGLIITAPLPSPPGRMISLAKWRRGVHLSLDFARCTFSAVSLSTVIEGEAAMLRCRLIHSGHVDFTPEQLVGQEVVVRQKKVEADDLMRLATGHLAVPDDITGSTALRVLTALHGGFLLPELQIPENDCQWTAGAVSLTPEQGKIYTLLQNPDMKAALVDCAPGTGKTTALVASLCRHASTDTKGWIIVGAMSNAATAQAVQAWKKVDRLVPGVRLVTAKNRNRMDPELQTDYDYPVLWPRVLIEAVIRVNQPGINTLSPLMESAVRHLFAHQFMHKQDIVNSSIHKALKLGYKTNKPTHTIFQTFLEIHKPQLFFGTVVSVRLFFSSELWLRLNTDKVTTTVFDESSQLPRYSLVPMIYTFTKSRFVFIGDSRQLAPYAEQAVPEKLKSIGIGFPFIEAVKQKRAPVIRLNRVFRCPGEITDLVSKLYYDGMLSGKDRVSPVPILQGLRLPSSFPLLLISAETKERRDGTSFVNDAEAEVVVQLVEQWKTAKKEDEKAVVLCLYLAQAANVSRRLDNDVYVNTVDASQGAEYDLVFLLTTRTENVATCRFINDATRINVGLTRSKQATIVIGDRRNLSGAQEWKRVLELMPEEAKLEAKLEDFATQSN
ncbi:hypothetical protein CRE_21961 [Caenorhabditis remanei]|uniref:DNA2/NAM7 helicase-like C-terminal domain-containing protein n=1 Tax=Caenorhabditis remanei TaxID=31234 RepID=E3N3B6_CAERE|nr:hypothetical protein CRE_21961 [Caenorhabditis remanei]